MNLIPKKSSDRVVRWFLMVSVVLAMLHSATTADWFSSIDPPFFRDRLWDSPNWTQHVVQGVGDVVRVGVTAVAFVVSDADPGATAAGYEAGDEIRNALYIVGGALHNNGAPGAIIDESNREVLPASPRPVRTIPPQHSLVYHYIHKGEEICFVQVSAAVRNGQQITPPRWAKILPSGKRHHNIIETGRNADRVSLQYSTGERLIITSNGVLSFWMNDAYTPFYQGVLVTITHSGTTGRR